MASSIGNLFALFRWAEHGDGGGALAGAAVEPATLREGRQHVALPAALCRLHRAIAESVVGRRDAQTRRPLEGSASTILLETICWPEHSNFTTELWNEMMW